MQLSDSTRTWMGILIITIPTVQYGGYFLLQILMGRATVKSEVQRSYFRAGHAHAGVLILLALIAQLVVESTSLSSSVQMLVRIGFAAAPILIPIGFFGGAPSEGSQAKPLVRAIYVGAIILALSAVTLALGLIFR
jgi:hypothetical protein